MPTFYEHLRAFEYLKSGDYLNMFKWLEKATEIDLYFKWGIRHCSMNKSNKKFHKVFSKIK